MSLRVLVDPFTTRGVGLRDSYPSRWSEARPPWAYTSEEQFRVDWPSGVKVVPLHASGATLYERLANTLAATTGRVVVQLEAAVYHLTSFRMEGASGNPVYAFGFWFGDRLQGLVGRGADKTFVQMDADSMTTAQLNRMKTMTAAAFSPLPMGLCRIDGLPGSPVILAGITFQADDQQMLTAVAPDVDVVVPQPAPHQGVIIYSGSDSIVSYCRFRGAGRALNPAPPFEMANLNSQYGTHLWRRTEFDGRRSPDRDPARPRRVGLVMVNNETRHEMVDCWLHHSNTSRYAANDENRDTTGAYIVRGCQADHVSDNENTDPALNGGKSLRGFTNPSPFGWESCSGPITVDQSVIAQTNPFPRAGAGQLPTHFQFTSVGGRDPRGGRLQAVDNVYLWPAHPHLNGFAGISVSPSTWWWRDGVNTTLTVIQRGNRLLPFEVGDPWPPSAAQLAAAGVSYNTHYLLRRFA